MRFRYYIFCHSDGSVKGTNDRDVAIQFAIAEDWAVIDTQTNTQIYDDATEDDIPSA